MAQLSAWQHFKKAASNSNSHYKSLLISSWKELALVFALTFLLSQYFLILGKIAGQDDAIRLLSQLGLVSTGLLQSLFVVMIIPLRLIDIQKQAPSSTPFWPFFKKHLGPLALEGIRMFAFVLLWSLLLIIPGIFKQLRWNFLAYIVMFDKEYQSNEELDPLTKSNELVRGITVLILLLGIAEFASIYILEKILSTSFSNMMILGSLFKTLLGLLISVYIYALGFSLYQQRLKEHQSQGGSRAQIPLETN